MSIRDNRRKAKQNVAVEVANLAAIAQHQEPIVNNEAPVRIQGETETRPELDAALSTGQLQAIALDVLNEIANTTQPETQTTEQEETEMNTNNPEVQVEETKVEVEAIMDTTTANPEEVDNLKIIKLWANTVPQPAFTFSTDVDINTLDGNKIVAMCGLPVVIPNLVVTAVLAELEKKEQVLKYLPMIKQVAETATEGECLQVAKLIDLGLAFVKPQFISIVTPLWTKLSTTINAFLGTTTLQPETADTTTADKEVEEEPKINSIVDTYKEAREQRVEAAKAELPKPTPVKEQTLTLGDLYNTTRGFGGTGILGS